MKMVLEMLLLALSNTNIEFIELEKLTWRFYTTAEILSITSIRVEFINKMKIAKVVLDKNSEIFMVYIATLKVSAIMFIYPSRVA